MSRLLEIIFSVLVLNITVKVRPDRRLGEGVELDSRARAAELVVFEGSGQTAPSVLQLHLHRQPWDGVQIEMDLVEPGQGKVAGSISNFNYINISTVVGVIYSNQFGKIGFDC